MSDARLKKLQEAWKEMEKLDESTTAGYGAKSGGITPVGGYGETEVTGVPREEGAAAGEKEVGEDHGEKGGMDGIVKPVPREEGAAAGEDEVGEEHGAEAAVDGANPVPREEGAAAGKSEVGEYGDHESFRQRVRGALGLDLNDKLNKGFDKDGKVPADKSSKR